MWLLSGWAFCFGDELSLRWTIHAVNEYCNVFFVLLCFFNKVGVATKRRSWCLISGASLPSLPDTNLCLHLLQAKYIWLNKKGKFQLSKALGLSFQPRNAYCCLQKTGHGVRVWAQHMCVHTNHCLANSHGPHHTTSCQQHDKIRAALIWHLSLQENGKAEWLFLYV